MTQKLSKRSEMIRKFMVDNKIDLTEVVDAVIESNGIVGVGLISLVDDVHAHVYDKIKGAK